MKSSRRGRETPRSKSARNITVPLSRATMTRSRAGEIFFNLPRQGVDAAGQARARNQNGTNLAAPWRGRPEQMGRLFQMCLKSENRIKKRKPRPKKGASSTFPWAPVEE